MGRKPKRKPSFFKVLVKDDFTNLLRLPPAFVDKHGEILPVNLKLRTHFGRLIYKVKLEQIDDDEYHSCCFTRGWNKFALDFGLKIGEFLVFWFNVGESTFDVSVYGVNGCERKITPTDFVTEISRDKDPELKCEQSRAGEVENDDLDDEANPQLKLVMKEHRKSRVSLRKEFAVAAGLVGAKAVVLKYPPEERHWPVMVDYNTRVNWFRLDITQGWNEFRRENGLIMGKSYVFEYIRRSNVIEVKMID